jgi:hypothetical protein
MPDLLLWHLCRDRQMNDAFPASYAYRAGWDLAVSDKLTAIMGAGVAHGLALA